MRNKKFFGFVLALSFILMLVPVSVSADECEDRKSAMRDALGTSDPEQDLNGDGIVNLADVSLLAEELEGQCVPPPEPEVRIFPQPNGGHVYVTTGTSVLTVEGVSLSWTESVPPVFGPFNIPYGPDVGITVTIYNSLPYYVVVTVPYTY